MSHTHPPPPVVCGADLVAVLPGDVGATVCERVRVSGLVADVDAVLVGVGACEALVDGDTEAVADAVADGVVVAQKAAQAVSMQ